MKVTFGLPRDRGASTAGSHGWSVTFTECENVSAPLNEAERITSISCLPFLGSPLHVGAPHHAAPRSHDLRVKVVHGRVHEVRPRGADLRHVGEALAHHLACPSLHHR